MYPGDKEVLLAPTYIIEIVTFIDSGFVAVWWCFFGIQKTLASHKPTQSGDNVAARIARTEMQTTLFDVACCIMILIFEVDLWVLL